MTGTKNIDAFKAYLEGERKFSVTDQSSMDAAIVKFRDAISIDPSFARAHGFLSYALVRSALVGWQPHTVIKGEALTSALRAVELDHNNYLQLAGNKAEIYEACDYAPYWDLAFVYLNIDDRMEDSVDSYRKAIHLYDNLTDRLDRKTGLLAEAAVAFIQFGDRVKAIQLLEKSKLIPGWYRWNHGFAHYMEQDYAAALIELQHPDLDPKNPNVPSEVLVFLAVSLARYNDIPGGQAAMNEFRSRRPGVTKDELKAHWKFQDSSDQDHWDTGIDMTWV